MMNRTIIMGRPTAELEVTVLPTTGNAVAKGTLANDRDYKTKSGEKIADFYKFVAFGKTAEFMQKYLQKGKLVILEGRFENRDYENKDGVKVYVTELIVEKVTPIEWPEKETKETKEVATNENMQQVAMEDEEVPF